MLPTLPLSPDVPEDSGSSLFLSQCAAKYCLFLDVQKVLFWASGRWKGCALVGRQGWGQGEGETGRDSVSLGDSESAHVC